MEKKYKIQIIIPVYNAEKTLRKCLDSIKDQTFDLWQAILVDDASKDKSVEIMNEYNLNDERFVCLVKEKNEGAAAARNSALEIADAEYIAFLDSDDYWEKDMLETLYKKVKEHDADVAQCRFIYDFPDGKRFLPSGAFKGDVFLEGKALKSVYIKMMTGINMNHVCMKLVKGSLMKNVRFDTSLPTAEDLDMVVKIFKHVKRYYFSDKAMYHYCRWENSVTGKGLPFVKRLDANRRVARSMASMLPYWNVNTPFYIMLTYLRPYIIIVSKTFRIVREKILVR